MEEGLENSKLLQVEKPTLMMTVQVGGKRSFRYIEFSVLADSGEKQDFKANCIHDI